MATGQWAEIGDSVRRKPLLKIEVAYALRDEQVLLELEAAEGTTARQAVERSGILQRFPEIDLARASLGIFGRLVAPDTPLRNRDRVEIYRPLIADPKDARRERAARRR